MHFVHLSTKYSTALGTPVFIYSMFLLFNVSKISNTPRSVDSLPEIKSGEMFVVFLESRPLDKSFQKYWSIYCHFQMCTFIRERDGLWTSDTGNIEHFYVLDPILSHLGNDNLSLFESK